MAFVQSMHQGLLYALALGVVLLWIVAHSAPQHQGRGDLAWQLNRLLMPGLVPNALALTLLVVGLLSLSILLFSLPAGPESAGGAATVVELAP